MQALRKSGGLALLLQRRLRHLYRCPAGHYVNSKPYTLLPIKNRPSALLQRRGVIIWRVGDTTPRSIASSQRSSAIFRGDV